MLGIGHHDLAVSSPDVGRERLASARRVDSTEHVTTDTGSCHLVQELGGVSQQYTDMHRTVWIHEPEQCRGAGRCVANMLSPRPAFLAVLHRSGVPGCAFGQQLLDGLAHGTPGVSLLSYLWQMDTGQSELTH